MSVLGTTHPRIHPNLMHARLLAKVVGQPMKYRLVAVLFPATLGVFIIFWDPVWGILIDGLTFFCAAIYTAMLPNVEPCEFEEEFSIRETVNGIAIVTGNSKLLLGFAATLVVNVLCFPIFLVVAPYAISNRFNEEMWGVCLAASGFGACIGSIVTVLVSGHERLIGLAVTCGLLLAGTTRHGKLVLDGDTGGDSGRCRRSVLVDWMGYSDADTGSRKGPR